MPILHPRVKMVSFRLSEDEYRRALETCSSCQIRSISALARNATVHFLAEQKQQQQHDHQAATLTNSGSDVCPSPSWLRSQLQAMAESLARLTNLLDRQPSAVETCESFYDDSEIAGESSMTAAGFK